MFDVVVVGGGPIGLYTAKLCEDMGYRVVVLEEDREIGKPVKCSGLISRNIMGFFPDIENWGVIENVVDSAVLHSKRSKLVLRKKKAAYVINRAKFDKKLSEFLRSEIRLNCKVEKITVEKDFVEIDTDKGKVKGEMVIGCDGPDSIVGKISGRKESVKGLIGVVREEDRSNNVGMYFDKKLLRDGFFWKIPRGESTEYGVWGKDVKFKDLEKFFGIKDYERFAGLIPVRPVRKSYSRRVLLIGGSAGQVKPWSGGGVIYGLTCARIAARIVEKAFRFNDFSEGVLKEYESKWKGRIGKQMKFGLLFRKFLKS
ncbi:MAG: FAD-dependent monooxygenase, partial [Candidatus Aenigmarchaeota archaeon]